MGGIIEIDVHGLHAQEAWNKIEKLIDKADSGTYRIRVIHGYHGGTSIMNTVREECSYGRQPKVKRIEMGTNPGITEIILREY